MQKSIEPYCVPLHLLEAGTRCGLDQQCPCSHGVYILVGKLGIVQVTVRKRGFRKS